MQSIFLNKANIVITINNNNVEVTIFEQVDNAANFVSETFPLVEDEATRKIGNLKVTVINDDEMAEQK